MVKRAYLVFDLGSLQVYTLQDEPSFMVPAWTPGSYTDNYYWRDAASPQGYGPFNHVTGAIEHYKWYVKTCRGEQKKLEAPKAAAIRVDFQTKKRVDTDV